MWFPTKEKVEREIDVLLTRFERIEKRAEFNISESNRIGSLFGPNEMAEVILRNTRKIIENLHEGAAETRYELLSLRALANNIAPVAKVASQYASILDNMDFARKAGEKA